MTSARLALTNRTHYERPWLVMLYMACDDIPLDGTVPDTLSEAATNLIDFRLNDNRRNEPLRTNTNMHLVILVDGYYEGEQVTKEVTTEVNGNLLTQTATVVKTSTRLLYLGSEGLIDQGDVLRSELKGLDDQVNSGYEGTLTRFIRWARRTYPGSHTMLSLVGHGGGWSPDDGGTGAPPVHPNGSPGWRGVCMDYRAGRALSTRALNRALRDALYENEAIDVLFFDACLMGMIECAYEVRKRVKYLVAGQNWLWAELPYQEYLDARNLTRDTTAEQLARKIVECYNRFYEESTLAPFCLAALDLSQIETLGKRIDVLAQALIDSLKDDDSSSKIREAYRQAQKFDYDADLEIGDNEVSVDLHDFAAKLLDQSLPERVHAAATAVMSKISAPDKINQRIEKGTITRRVINGESSLSDPQIVLLLHSRSGAVPNLTAQFTNPNHQLSNASGLSIYMPLGKPDVRPVATAQEAEAGATIDWFHQYYKTGAHLTFTANTHVRAWVELLERLGPEDQSANPGSFDRPVLRRAPISEVGPNTSRLASDEQLLIVELEKGAEQDS